MVDNKKTKYSITNSSQKCDGVRSDDLNSYLEVRDIWGERTVD